MAHSSLGQWLSYLLTEDRVALATSAGTRGVFVITAVSAVAGLALARLLTWALTNPLLDQASPASRVAGDRTPGPQHNGVASIVRRLVKV